MLFIVGYELLSCEKSYFVFCSMREMPGMSQMPPLPVSINEDLANSILPNTVQVIHNQFDLIAHFCG